MKKTLKVKPATRIYRPSYPSHADKNPLLYPETRPYPFALKFINWASAGMLGALALGSTAAFGQSTPDSLYNPFTFENARVPYRPVSFGTGMPQRMKSEKAVQIIRKAFEESGIALKNNVPFTNDGIKVELSGYNEQEDIGFLFLDYRNMDPSFAIGNEPKEFQLSTYLKGFEFKAILADNEKRATKYFNTFLQDKDKYISSHSGKYSSKYQKEFSEKLKSLDTLYSSKKNFIRLLFEKNVSENRIAKLNKAANIHKIFNHIDQRFPALEEKNALLKLLTYLVSRTEKIEQLQARAIEEITKLMDIKSDKKFVQRFLTINAFVRYSGRYYGMNRIAKCADKKIDIMNTYKIGNWFKYTDQLDVLQEYHWVSLSEAQQITNDNKLGKNSIVLISARDNRMMLPNYSYFNEDYQNESIAVIKEMNEKNGLTEEILNNRKKEYNENRQKYSYSKLKKLPPAERDSMQSLGKKELNEIKEKYKAMEKLSEAELAVFQNKLKEIRKRENDWKAEENERKKLEVYQRLEKEVKMYIQWARSQMGG